MNDKSAATRAVLKPALVTSFVGERVVGMILNRGPVGFEAFDQNERSLGMFMSADDAHAALVAEALNTVGPGRTAFGG